MDLLTASLGLIQAGIQAMSALYARITDFQIGIPD
jgi:hypothetical protein